MLKEAGYEVEAVKTRPHAPKVTRFERSRPNELWQTDLFTFMLKRERRRVYLVAYMDLCGVLGYVELGCPVRQVLGSLG